MTHVSDSVVEARVRRAVRRDGGVLRKTRPGNTWAQIDLGAYYIVDAFTNFATRRHCDLEQLARDYNALRPGEVMAEAGT